MQRFCRTLTLLYCFVLAAAVLTHGQTGNTVPTIKEIEQAVAKLAAEESSSAEANELLTVNQDLLNALQGIKAQSAAKEQFAKQRASVGDTLSKVTKESEQPYSPRVPKDGDALEDLAKNSQTIELERNAAVANLQELTGERTRRAERVAQLPEQIVAARNELERLRGLPADAAPSDPVLAQPQAQLRQATIERQQATLTTLEAEAAFYTEASELLNAQMALAELKVERLTAEAKAWQEAVSKARSADAKAIATQAAARVADTNRHPYLRRLDQEILKLAQQRIGDQGTSTRQKQTADRKLEVNAQLNELKLQYADSQQQLTLIKSANLDLGDTTGELLLQLDQQLPSLTVLRAELEAAAKTTASLFIDKRNLDRDIRGEAGSLTVATSNGLLEAKAEQPIPDTHVAAFRTELRESLDTRRKLLHQLRQDKESLRSDFSELTVDLQGLIAVVASFKLFIDENIPWLRSQAPWSFSKIADDTKQSAILLEPARWQPVAQSLPISLRTHAPLWVAFGLILALLMLKRRRLRKELAALAEVAQLHSCSSFRVTLQALVITALLAAPLALLIWFPAWSLNRMEVSSYTEAVAYLSGYVLFFSALYQILRRHGLAVAHLGMTEDTRARLRRAMKWFAPCYLIVVLIVQLYRRTVILDPTLDGRPSMLDGRSFYILQMLLLGTLLYLCSRILIPSRFGRIQQIAISLFAVGLPLGLLTVSLLGYHYAVVELEQRLRSTAWFVLGAVLLFFIVKRGVLVARRRLRRQELLASRALRKAEAKGEDLDPEALIDEQAPDATSAQRQSDRLIRAFSVVLFAAGLWGIWSDLLPALKVLDSVTIWPATESAATPSEPAVSDGGNLIPGLPLSTNTTEAAEPASSGVSLADILLALLTFFLTYIAVQNIPGLLEVSVLQNVQLRPGSSYAISSVVRYVIVVIGLMAGFGMLGISWGKVQWLAAAVTVGIGFGLQEIFANFVAGLILLFERPMRVGDVVSVGTTSGKVSQIRMRATTITAFNNQELVVPNKSFITSEFINWTLSDSVLRAEILVGVAYGSDVEKTKTILEREGVANVLTLDDPAPSVLFKAFGASTLDFELRVHVNRVDDLAQVKSQLHFAINSAFAEAGIEIAFPQLDVHLKTAAGELSKLA